MEEIKITTDFIKLQQFLKLARIVGQGSDAKQIILDGLVKYNGEICLQRGKKVYDCDIVEVENVGTFKCVR